MKRFAASVIGIVLIAFVALCVPFQFDGKYRTSALAMLIARNDAAVALAHLSGSQLPLADAIDRDSTLEIGSALPSYYMEANGVGLRGCTPLYPIYCDGRLVALLSSNHFMGRIGGDRLGCGPWFLSEPSEAMQEAQRTTESFALVYFAPPPLDSAGSNWVVTADFQRFLVIDEREEDADHPPVPAWPTVDRWLLFSDSDFRLRIF